jgi:hypothetical protein
MSDIIPYPIVQRIIDASYTLKCAGAFSEETLNILTLAS